MLSLTAVHWELNGVTAGAMEILVAVEYCLNIVFAGRNISKVANGIAERIIVRYDDWLSGGECIHVNAEKNLRLDGEINLHARFL